MKLMTRTFKDYKSFINGIQELLNAARRKAARSIDSIQVATYWEVGRRIIVYEQKGKVRAEYGEALLERVSADLTKRLGRGFSVDNLENMRKFYLGWPEARKSASMMRKLPMLTKGQKSETLSRNSSLSSFANNLPLSWSHYVRLMNVKNQTARSFYEGEALQGGWSVRQLNRQIDSQFYERLALSRNKVSMIRKGRRFKSKDKPSPEQAIKDPYVLEFLGLKDEYSESELEEALIHHLESFLLELGGDFTFVARQKRLRVGNEWYRVDLVFYHRRLRCMVLIDLKIGRFTHADAGQMHLYLNYAKHHWTHRDENPPVGLILCAAKDEEVAKYALEDLPNKVLAAEYLTKLPKESAIVREIKKTRLALLK